MQTSTVDNLENAGTGEIYAVLRKRAGEVGWGSGAAARRGGQPSDCVRGNICSIKTALCQAGLRLDASDQSPVGFSYERAASDC